LRGGGEEGKKKKKEADSMVIFGIVKREKNFHNQFRHTGVG